LPIFLALLIVDLPKAYRIKTKS